MARFQKDASMSRWKQRVGVMATGYGAKKLEELLLDWLLYGWVTYMLTKLYGPVWGSLATFAVMAPLSAVLCLVYIKLYDWAKLDLFGFEMVREFRNGDYEKSGWFRRLCWRFIRSGNAAAFIGLSIVGDPFLVTIYLRQDGSFNGLTARDKRIFWGSVLFSNGYWTLRWTVIVQVVVYLWHLASA